MVDAESVRVEAGVLGPFSGLAEVERVGVRSTKTSRGVNVKTFPLGRLQAELGYVHVTDFGTLITVPFRQAFPGNPALVHTVIGYVEILGVKIPAPVFLFDVQPDHFTLFSLVTNGWVSYAAWEM